MDRVAPLLRGALVVGFQLVLILLVVAAALYGPAPLADAGTAPDELRQFVEVDLDAWSE